MQELATGQQAHVERLKQPLTMPAAVVWGTQDEIFPCTSASAWPAAGCTADHH
jgi:hypothetical protein